MKPFLQGKKNLDAEPLRPPAPFPAAFTSRCTSPRHDGSASPAGGSDAQVDVVKEGDKVVRLIVTCTCGERVEIECLYTAGR
jgi:hypothetical protein